MPIPQVAPPAVKAMGISDNDWNSLSITEKAQVEARAQAYVDGNYTLAEDGQIIYPDLSSLEQALISVYTAMGAPKQIPPTPPPTPTPRPRRSPRSRPPGWTASRSGRRRPRALRYCKVSFGFMSIQTGEAYFCQRSTGKSSGV